MAEDKDFDKLFRAFLDAHSANVIGGSFGMSHSNNRKLIKYGAEIRDKELHKYSILPGAIQTFISIAVSREWQVLGTPRSASRTVDMLHGSKFVDADGIVHHGFEELMSRMCMDWLTIGRCMFFSKPNIINDRTMGWTPFEYIDVADVQSWRDKNNLAYWQYKYPGTTSYKRIEQDNIFYMDSVRVGGSGGVIGPVAWLIPVAHLDWLLRQHDSMQLDGRKIRDIMVTLTTFKEQIKEAITASMALSAGEDPSKWGVPLAGIELGGYEGPISDLFHRIGLSEMPREFTRQEFETRYAREISATLGLPIGQFWHDPRGTNRSLEQVTQERSTLKGPAYYTRSLQRTVNNSPTTGTNVRNRSILQFQEETDNSSLKEQAEATLALANAIKALEEALGEREEPKPVMPNQPNNGEENPEENPEEEQEQTQRQVRVGTSVIGNKDAWINFLQSKGLIPPNIGIENLAILEEQSLRREQPEDPMERGWVRLDSNGMVLERRYDFVTSVS